MCSVRTLTWYKGNSPFIKLWIISTRQCFLFGDVGLKSWENNPQSPSLQRCGLWLNEISKRATNKTFHKKKQASRLKLWSCLSPARDRKKERKYNISRRLLSAGRSLEAGRLDIVLLFLFFCREPSGKRAHLWSHVTRATELWNPTTVLNKLIGVSLFIHTLNRQNLDSVSSWRPWRRTGSHTRPHTCSVGRPRGTPCRARRNLCQRMDGLGYGLSTRGGKEMMTPC